MKTPGVKLWRVLKLTTLFERETEVKEVLNHFHQQICKRWHHQTLTDHIINLLDPFLHKDLTFVLIYTQSVLMNLFECRRGGRRIIRKTWRTTCFSSQLKLIKRTKPKVYSNQTPFKKWHILTFYCSLFVPVCSRWTTWHRRQNKQELVCDGVGRLADQFWITAGVSAQIKDVGGVKDGAPCRSVDLQPPSFWLPGFESFHFWSHLTNKQTDRHVTPGKMLEINTHTHRLPADGVTAGKPNKLSTDTTALWSLSGIQTKNICPQNVMWCDYTPL